LATRLLFFQSLTAIHCFRTLCRPRCTWRQHADIWTSPECSFTTVLTLTVETWNSQRPFIGFDQNQVAVIFFAIVWSISGDFVLSYFIIFY